MHQALAQLFSELVQGATSEGSAFVLNSGDRGLLQSLDAVSASDASGSMNGGASLAAHAKHLAYGLSLMNSWARDGGNPFANANWDDAWKTTDVSSEEWDAIRRSLREEATRWADALASPRGLSQVELSGMIGSVAHLAYHLGAMRQISPSVRGPKEGTFK